jgi:hypothetical protein
MFHWHDRFSPRLCRRLVTVLAVLALVTAGWPFCGGGSVSYAGIFDIFKSKSKSAPPPATEPGPQAEEELNKRRDLLRQLQMQHDSETDPARKIAYDRQIVSALDPYTDFEKIRNVQNEIKQHEAEIKQREQEAQQRTKEQERQQAISQVKRALAEHRYEDAEQAVLRAVQILDEAQAQPLLSEVRTRRLVVEVKELLARNDIDRANDKNRQALQLAPNDPEAQALQRAIDHALARRKTAFVLKTGLMLCLTAGLLVGLYWLLRPKKWVLAGIKGACEGQVFPLDSDEVKVGALGPPDGECDIVIYDAKCKISRLHCVIMRHGWHLYLTDESTNGTWVNDTEVEKGSSVRLRKGDQITLADATVLLVQ